MNILKKRKKKYFSHVPKIIQPKNQVPRSKGVLCSPQTHRHKSEYRGHPFRVSEIFPSTYYEPRIGPILYYVLERKLMSQILWNTVCNHQNTNYCNDSGYKYPRESFVTVQRSNFILQCIYGVYLSIPRTSLLKDCQGQNYDLFCVGGSRRQHPDHIFCCGIIFFGMVGPQDKMK